MSMSAHRVEAVPKRFPFSSWNMKKRGNSILFSGSGQVMTFTGVYASGYFSILRVVRIKTQVIPIFLSFS